MPKGDSTPIYIYKFILTDFHDIAISLEQLLTTQPGVRPIP